MGRMLSWLAPECSVPEEHQALVHMITIERHLPILCVFKPKPVPISQTLKLVLDDGSEEGSIAFQHASREEFQLGGVIVVHGSYIC